MNCEVVGEKIPPPFVVDVSNLHLEEPFGKITLGDMLHLLPRDGTVRFARGYSSLFAAVCCVPVRYGGGGGDMLRPQSFG